MEYQPDFWKLILQSGDVRVFASWSGSYLYGPSWKLSSGATKIEELSEFWRMPQFTGSVYNLHKEMEGFTGYGKSVLDSLLSQNTEAKLISIEEALKVVNGI